MNDNLIELQNKLGYKFKNTKNLEKALIHSSYANENKKTKLSSNERLEFLGDSILSYVVSEHIFINYPNLPEGELTKIRANVVCEQSLRELSEKLGIGNDLILGKGEEQTGGRKRASILADAFEAVVSAIFLDGGIEEAKRFVINNLKQRIADSLKSIGKNDYKTSLQEELQKNGDVRIAYEIIQEKGPDHDKEFKVQVKCDERVLGIGIGKSKKEAEQNAAKKALNL